MSAANGARDLLLSHTGAMTAARIATTVAVAVLLAAAAAAALLGGVPRQLPGVALGSGALLRLERGGAIFWGGLLLGVVVVRALQGRFPTELATTGARYAELNEDLEQAVTATEASILTIEQELDVLRRRLEDVHRRLTDGGIA